MKKMAKKTPNKKKKLNFVLIFIICLLIVFLVAFLGSIFTSSGVNSLWYDSIKPKITPPNWVFPLVWNILFLLIAISLFFAWTRAKNKKEKIKVGFLFGINLFLNILWSFLFFGLRNPLFGFIEIILVWLSILALIIGLWGISKISSWFLVPYILWVSFASIINYLAI
ncbi:tryptophan-rich sensory protein [Candidatus Pacearchaeota archaeon]|nr:tryptophan-rich sensory protein [Candidatus Pacearchaeota archaeon]